MTTTIKPALMKARDVAELYAIGLSSAYALGYDGTLETVKVGRSLRFVAESVYAHLDKLRGEAAA